MVKREVGEVSNTNADAAPATVDK